MRVRGNSHIILGFVDEFSSWHCPGPDLSIFSISFRFFFLQFSLLFSETPQVDSWRYPEDVFDAILQQRPDIHHLLPGDEAVEEDALDAEIARFGAKIEETSRTLGYPKGV